MHYRYLWKLFYILPVKPATFYRRSNIYNSGPNPFQSHPTIKGKTVLKQPWTGPEGSRKLTLPDFKTIGPDGGKLVSSSHRPSLPPTKYSWYSFLSEAESTPAPQCGRKDYVNEEFPSGIEPAISPTRNAVPQPTAVPNPKAFINLIRLSLLLIVTK